MADAIEHIVKRMKWYMALSRTLLADKKNGNSSWKASRDTLQERITEMYQTILQYEMQSVLYCYKEYPIVKIVKDIFTPDKWTTRLQDIKNMESIITQDMALFADGEIVGELRDIANAAHELDAISKYLRNIVEHQEKIDKEREEKEKKARWAALRNLIGQFTTARYAQRMESNVTALPGTCQWLSEHENFKKWLESPGSLLLVSADTSCGKSVLARHLIEQVLPECTTTIAHFFFKDNSNPDKVKLENAISAILFQLFQGNIQLVEHCEDEILMAGNNLSSDPVLLWKILVRASRYPNDGSTICILDGLDECTLDDVKILASSLKTFVKNGDQSNVKFLITTRGYTDILEQFDGFGSGCLQVSSHSQKVKIHIQKDIDLVVDARLQTLVANNPKLAQSKPDLIREALFLNPSKQRTYLWAELVFDVLLRKSPKDTLKDWQRVIDNPPKTVFKKYEEFLDKMTTRVEHTISSLLNGPKGIDYLKLKDSFLAYLQDLQSKQKRKSDSLR